jgi:hypothetical protein
MHLEYKINNLKNLFNEVIVELDHITVEDFDSHFSNAKAKMVMIHQLRDELRNNYPKSELQKDDKELVFLAKQIENKYDNIIERYIEERSLISGKLRSVGNKKKIANYSR